MKMTLPFTCPCESKSRLKSIDGGYICTKEGCEHALEDNRFPIVNGIPVLVSETKCDTVCEAGSTQTYISRPLRDYSFIRKLVVGEGTTTKDNCKVFIEELFRINEYPKVLVIGSGEKGSGTEMLWNNNSIEVHGIDVYGTDSTHAICDAHYLPFEGESYDGVWIQAVLEHVVQPTMVVDEIFRVLKLSGIVYAETPFMQQVHEGAYDFTRFTVLGHRYLFNRFEAIRFGGNKGPELVFAWSIRYLVWSITRSRALGRIVGLAIGLLMRPLEYLVSNESMHDASSGVFFLGRKLANHTLTHKELIKLYRGQMK